MPAFKKEIEQLYYDILTSKEGVEQKYNAITSYLDAHKDMRGNADVMEQLVTVVAYKPGLSIKAQIDFADRIVNDGIFEKYYKTFSKELFTSCTETKEEIQTPFQKRYIQNFKDRRIQRMYHQKEWKQQFSDARGDYADESWKNSLAVVGCFLLNTLTAGFLKNQISDMITPGRLKNFEDFSREKRRAMNARLD